MRVIAGSEKAEKVEKVKTRLLTTHLVVGHGMEGKPGSYAVRYASLHHGQGAAGRLLARLEHKAHLAAKVVPLSRQQLGCSQQAGDVAGKGNTETQRQRE